eukprot:6492624-Amphidinium_carterae.3
MEFKSFLPACQLLCTACHWQVAWHELEDSARPIMELSPRHVTCLPMLSTPILGSPFWPSKKPSRPAKKRARHSKSKTANASASSTSVPLLEHGLGSASDTFFGHLSEEEEEEQEVDIPTEAEDEEKEEEEEENSISPNMELLLRAEGLLCLHQELESARMDEGSVAPPAPEPVVCPPVPETGTAPACAPEALQPSGSQDHALLPPPPPVPPVPVQHRPRVVAAATYILPNGRISFHFSKNSFEAVCNVHEPLGSCNMSRTCKGRMRRGVESSVGGRPLGFLCKWLDVADAVADKDMHKDRGLLSTFGHDERLAARMELLATDTGQELATYERDLMEGEEDEPQTLAGLL